MSEPAYPFVPKSLRSVRPGHYWAIPLDDGRWASGIVLQTSDLEVPRTFVAALLDWVGDEPPVDDDVAEISGVLRHGYAGTRAITHSGDQVRGLRDLERNPIELPETVSHRGGGGPVWVMQGGHRIREATREEAASLPVLSVLGFSALQIRANKTWVTP